MIRIIAYIRPHRLEATKLAIANLGANGLTVGDSRGRGHSEEYSKWSEGGVHLVAMPIKSRIEVVVPESLKESVIEAILDQGCTGEPGDGKIFVSEITDALRIRTGERGPSAV